MKSVNIVVANELIETINITGNGALNTTLGNGAVADNEDGTVKLPIAADIFAAGSMVLIEGTTNYDGIRAIRSAPAGYVNIEARYIAETVTTSDTVKVAISPSYPFELIEVEIHMSAAPTTSEAFTLTRDAGLGVNYDTLIRSIDFSVDSMISWSWTPSNRLIYPDPDDKIRVAWNNAEARTYGLTLKYRRI